MPCPRKGLCFLEDSIPLQNTLFFHSPYKELETFLHVSNDEVVQVFAEERSY